MMDVSQVANSVVYMASVPLDTNVQFITVMATKMPFVGRGWRSVPIHTQDTVRLRVNG
jgi:hypothetical protein